ncbi:MAG: 3-keto-5-aminohexanoate cleavage protein [Deltaproteobacteria bacterium]|jgi:uncharacterized protein (DUF849 family)|nr:3-keto-5-aminohexanoate cleavage protein [Deltaproteobacteria bacterium]
MAKIFITAAITGAIHTPTLSEYLPLTEQQIIDQAVGAHEAGAAVVHIHGRDPATGRPSVDKGVIGTILSGIKKRCNVAICLTTGAGLGMSLEERVSGVPLFGPEIASCNSGSFNFYLGPLAKNKKMQKPLFDWEVPYLESTEDLVFSNTFKGLRYYIKTMHEHGSLPEFEVYEAGMINNIAYLREEGTLKGLIYIQFVMGIMGGLPASVDNLVFLRQTADNLLGKGGYVWSCAAAGRNQFPIIAAGLAMGGNIRVGLEDNLYLKPGVLAKNSAEQVTAVRSIAEAMGYEIATSDEARAVLKLKGGDKVKF